MVNQDFTTTLPEPTIRAGLQHDLQDARALLEQAKAQPDGKKYRKAAEIILLKVLHADPGNQEATILLQNVRDLPEQPRAPQVPEEVPFTATPLTFKNEPRQKRSKVPLVLIAAIVVFSGLLLKMRSHPAGTNARPAPVAQTPTQSQQNLEPRVAPSTYPTSTAPEQGPAVSGPATPTPLTRVQTAPVNVTVTVDKGRLAISSPTAVDIFQEGQYLGSTPTTLQLPAGRQTLEYRHGDLRTVIASEIKSNETTSVSVTFPVTVQINAKPWAQVFLEDGTRRPLGQTPLSGVAVPIGGVLAFENPNFSTKSYRITEKDTAIQVNFP